MRGCSDKPPLKNSNLTFGWNLIILHGRLHGITLHRIAFDYPYVNNVSNKVILLQCLTFGLLYACAGGTFY